MRRSLADPSADRNFGATREAKHCATPKMRDPPDMARTPPCEISVRTPQSLDKVRPTADLKFL
jgi:hypothetical protein